MTSQNWWVGVETDYTNVESELETIAADVSNEHAHLIAAAPELARSAEGLINFVMGRYNLKSEDELTCPHMRALAAALRKAKGEPQ